MGLFGYSITRKKAAAQTQQMSRKQINEQAINKLYEQLTRYFGKGQYIWNKDDLTSIIQNGYLFNPDVYAIINKIIQTSSMIAWQMYEVRDTKALGRYKAYKQSGTMDAILEYHKKALEPVETHPLTELLEQPNPLITGTLFDQNLLGYYCLLGNSYLNKIVIAGSKGSIAGELQVLPAYLVNIIYGDTKNVIQGYGINNWNDQKYNFTKEEIYHFKTFNPNYDIGQFLYGASPSISPTLAKSNESYQAAVSLIQNLGAMGILSSGNDDTIDPEQSQAIQDKYYSEYGGAKNRGKMLVVGHKLDFTNMAQSITDLDLIKGQEQDFLTLCRAYGVDPKIMGHPQASAFNNYGEAKKDFVQNRILPLKYMQSEAYNKFLLADWNSITPRQYYIDVDYNSIPELQADTDKLSSRLQNEIKVGLITPAEAAKLMGYPELTNEEANQLWVSTQMIPMAKANLASTPVQVPAITQTAE